MSNKIVEKFNNNKNKIMNILQKTNPFVLILQVLSFAMLFIDSIKMDYIKFIPGSSYMTMRENIYYSKWFSIQKLSFLHENENGEVFKGPEFLFILFAALLVITIIITLCEIIQRKQLFNPIINLAYYAIFGIISLIFFGNLKDKNLGLSNLNGGHIGDSFIKIHKEAIAYVFFAIIIVIIVFKIIYYLSKYYIDKKDNSAVENVEEK